ncbi:MAG: M48 family metalloprotease [Actinobacteria bacterium]|nr:M48 family metalloprotease [Actinomycetota bacterium]
MADEQVSGQPRRPMFEVEREQRWRIWLLFALLLALTFGSLWLACLVVLGAAWLFEPVVGPPVWLFSPAGIAILLGAALVFSLVHWGLSQVGARDRLLKAMHCRSLDPGDRYHQRLADIVAELHIATGAPRVECVTVRTVGFNAFAFSDLRGGAVIGVTEGALARLSRPQLQAVVAHEFAHVLSGSYVTATVSCLLFGVYSALADTLDGIADAGAEAGAETVGETGLAAIALWPLQFSSSVVSAAISRERERQADLAAARYTRDPLALAEALWIIGRHPGGAGSIPEGLGPLCIRATGPAGRSPARWRDTHPPLKSRIAALLTVANVSPRDFERQVEQADERHARREHWSPAPRPAGGSFGAPASTSSAAPESAAYAPAGHAPDAPPTAALPIAASGAVHVAPARATGGGPRAARESAGMLCPTCGVRLAVASYEGIDVLVCDGCGGRLVTTGQVGKLLARREAAFTDEQERLADLLAANGNRLRRAAVLARGRPGAALVACPRCDAPMMRRHYSYEYAVEVDHCARCDLLWFEKDELEALQILVERQTG